MGKKAIVVERKLTKYLKFAAVILALIIIIAYPIFMVNSYFKMKQRAEDSLKNIERLEYDLAEENIDATNDRFLFNQFFNRDSSYSVMVQFVLEKLWSYQIFINGTEVTPENFEEMVSLTGISQGEEVTVTLTESMRRNNFPSNISEYGSLTKDLTNDNLGQMFTHKTIRGEYIPETDTNEDGTRITNTLEFKFTKTATKVSFSVSYLLISRLNLSLPGGNVLELG